MVDLSVVKEHFTPGWGTFISCGRGWYQLILDTHNKMMEVDPNYQIQQIKEKFGGLRFYHTCCDSDAGWAIEEWAKNQSFKTCEECGQPGTQTPGGWIKTLCEEHK